MPAKSHHHALDIGYDLHWYTIQDVLGQGGFGITYLAYDNNLKHSVAIKEYLPVGVATRDTDSTIQPLSEGHRDDFRWGLERFLVEARTLTQFDHNNIVRVISVFELNQTAYMVMRYEHGKGLETLLPKGGTLEEKWLKRMTIPMIGGLSKVHAAGFIHRDIKPPNIFIREDQTPVLIDFGSARQALGAETRTLTAMISPGYAPFEQYHAKSDQQGPWTDIYGLGATLYRAVTGHSPLDALERSESIVRQQPDPYEHAADLAGDRYSAGFLAAIDHAMAFHGSDRPQTLKMWLTELQSVTPITPTTHTPTTIPAPPPQTEPENPLEEKPPRKLITVKRLFTLLLILFLLAALWVIKPWRAFDKLRNQPSDSGQIFNGSNNNTDSILAESRRALEDNPEDITARSQLDTLFEYHRTLGERALRNGNPNVARRHFRQASRAAPTPDARQELQQQINQLRDDSRR